MRYVCELRSPNWLGCCGKAGLGEHLMWLASSEDQDSSFLLYDLLLFLSSSSKYGVHPTHREHRGSYSIKASETSRV